MKSCNLSTAVSFMFLATEQKSGPWEEKQGRTVCILYSPSWTAIKQNGGCWKQLLNSPAVCLFQPVTKL